MIALPAMPAVVLKWWKLAIGIVLGALLCFPLAQCRGERIGEQKAALQLERANTAYLQQKARADELASAQRLRDQRAADNLERSLADAVRDIPDSVPNARRLARACAQLRGQGIDTSDLPQCR